MLPMAMSVTASQIIFHLRVQMMSTELGRSNELRKLLARKPVGWLAVRSTGS
jgi:hypothetical protein